MGWRTMTVKENYYPITLAFLGGSGKEASAYNAGDPGSIPGLGRSPGEGSGNPLQYSCLENPMVGYNPWGRKESDTTEQLLFHVHYSIRSRIENCYPIGRTVTMTIERS